jgi:Protein of unknown function (DUF3631)
VSSFLARFVSFPSPAAHVATTLWVAHSHMVDVFESTPRLALLSPEPGSGKTRVLEVLELLVPRPQHVLNASTAAVFRMIDGSRPTLLYDECDAIFHTRGKGDDSAEDLRALLNAGHRRSATIPRCVGPKHEVQHFPVYAACALAGLGDLPPTLMTRSVVIRMRRRAPDERVESYRRRLVQPQGDELRDRIAEWVDRVADECGEAWPQMPPGITDRPADCWEPLLAVADAAGGHWPSRAREACVSLTAAARATDDVSLGVRLLAEIRDVFGDTDRLASATLVERLVELDESPWGDMYGKPIDSRWLARKLRPYGVGSTKIRFGDTTARGYTAESFGDAWGRYLPSDAGIGGTSGTSGTPQVSDTKSFPDVDHVPDAGTEHAHQAEHDSPPSTSDVSSVPDVPLVGGADGVDDLAFLIDTSEPEAAPLCEICRRPMHCGQQRWHKVCSAVVS